MQFPQLSTIVILHFLRILFYIFYGFYFTFFHFFSSEFFQTFY